MDKKLLSFIHEMFKHPEKISKTISANYVTRDGFIYTTNLETEEFVLTCLTVIKTSLLKEYKQDIESDSLSRNKIKACLLKKDLLSDKTMLAMCIADAFWDVYKMNSRLQEKIPLTAFEVIEVTKEINCHTKIAVKELLLSLENDKTSTSLVDDEISIPIIQLDDSIAICPLIGEFDEHRTELLLNQTLFTCKEKSISNLIFELSSISNVNPGVAANFINVIKSLEMLGVKVTITGIKSNMALSIVLQDLSFKNMKITQNVKDAYMGFQGFGDRKLYIFK